MLKLSICDAFAVQRGERDDFFIKICGTFVIWYRNPGKGARYFIFAARWYYTVKSYFRRRVDHPVIRSGRSSVLRVLSKDASGW